VATGAPMKAAGFTMLHERTTLGDFGFSHKWMGFATLRG
jgi:hypothetical protein